MCVKYCAPHSPPKKTVATWIIFIVAHLTGFLYSFDFFCKASVKHGEKKTDMNCLYFFGSHVRCLAEFLLIWLSSSQPIFFQRLKKKQYKESPCVLQQQWYYCRKFFLEEAPCLNSFKASWCTTTITIYPPACTCFPSPPSSPQRQKAYVRWFGSHAIYIMW